MAEPWEADPIVSPQSGAAPWESDPEAATQAADSPTASDALPEAFVARAQWGQALGRIVNAGAQEAGRVIQSADATPLGFSDEDLKTLQKWGIFHDPAYGKGNAVQFATEALAIPAAQAWQAMGTGLSATVRGAGAAIGQASTEFGESQGMAQRAENEAVNAGNWFLIETGFGRFARVRSTDVGPQIQSIGGLPRPEDFSNAAGALHAGEGAPPPIIEQRLQALWQEKGIHPAEAANDAATDAFLKHDLTAPESAPRDGHAESDYISQIAAGNMDLPTLGQLDGLIKSTSEAERQHGLSEGFTDTQLKRLKVLNRIADEASGAEADAAIAEAKQIRDSVPDSGTEPDVADVGTLKQLRTEFGSLEKTATETQVEYEDGLARVLKRYVSQAVDGDDFAKAVFAKAFEEAKKNGVDTKLLSNETMNRFLGDLSESDAAFMRKQFAALGQRKIAAVGQTAGDVTHSLGAAVTSEPPLIPPSVQPPSPQGTLTTLAQGALEQLTGLAKNIQYIIDPMATGSDRAMVIAKDAMNSVRRIRWDHARIDADIADRFTPEQREFMWIAADEESVLRQIGETPTDTGLMTLGKEERAAVEEMHARAQSAWLHAQDAGIVEGEGLPAYTPRMVMNVANVASDLSPRALNELGRNVFTRTAQTQHRKYLTAEETEEAAKQLVGSRMAERGASIDEINAAVDKVQIAKDIRALPMATARLQEAAVWRDMINKIEDAGKAAGEPTVAVGFKPDNSWFTIAGHPSFTRWEPMLEKNPITGNWAARSDDGGNVIFQPKPIYLAPDFRGPMEAILDQTASNSKAVKGAMSAYDALMAIKGKAMTAILNSPLVHGQVVWGKVAEAAGGREWLGFGLYRRGNKIVNGTTGRAQELIERGLNPIGPRGSFQDITGMMEEPNLQPGRSLTSQVLSFFPGLYDEATGTAIKRAIDKAGDFWHNTLLWDRVRDVQFGLADHLSDHIVAKGHDRLTADRVAANFSNIIVGSLPKESMSAGARATANLALFSRSFTLGNLSTFKQAVVGLPKPILAQIERDYFNFRHDPETGTWQAPPSTVEDVRKIAMGMARRKAISTIAFSAALSYIGTALFQHATNMLVRNSTAADELKGYARRYQSLMRDAGDDPFELRHVVSRLSPTYDNEPNKQQRVHLGPEANGAETYIRLPFGKFGEEMVGWPTMPMQMLRQKLSPAASFMLDVVTNDDGNGNHIYDPGEPGFKGDASVAFAVAKHLVAKHLPANQLSAAWDAIHGDGDPKLNAARIVGPTLGFTVSEGRPGGMAKGEMAAVQDEAKVKFGLAWPDIKKQILHGDEDIARQTMTGMGLSVREQISLINVAKNPAAIKGRTALEFMRKATPEQRERFDRARGQ